MMTRKLHHSAVRVLATLAVAFVSGGCAMKGDIRTLQEELRAVSARQDSLMAGLRAETRQTQDTLRVQGDQMFDLRGDLNRQLQQINESLVRLEAIAGENQRGMMAVRDQLANMRRMPAVPMGTGLPTDSATEAGGESLIGGAGNPDELWGVAQAQYQRQSLNSAAAAFEQFIAEHPSDARVPNAHFFLADILVQQGQPEEALEAFEEIQALFPTHERVPEALYRIAELQIELGDEAAARLTLERIVNTYPGTTMAMLARDKLEEIG
jgi:tol-pal system protein YbgF